ncbi:UDP-N-acetylmuramoyl-L-alanine--D-glutamate ligase [Amphibiibacter pelophylacis]|uniref:UDP-N-acetylmuramoyl-L-alanine--D-glutamate ligase n=1 Tax=Amphibiibacter pelophylacis TaxID=1799477 RepID=A0ACC6P5H4_9BURK
MSDTAFFPHDALAAPLAGQSVAVLGLGASGLAMARWCQRLGAQVRVWDSRENPPMRADLPQGATLRSGAWTDAGARDWLDGVGLLLKSPGLSPHDAQLAPLTQGAAQRGLRVQGELDLFAQALAALRGAKNAESTEGATYSPTVLAITGTNGKTTTTALTACLLEGAGLRVAVAGNIGPTLLDTLAERLSVPAPQWPQAWVLELSSFQLQGVQGFEPTAATVLNVTQDHLDWHADMAEYAADKAAIFGASTLRVLNRDDATVRAMRPAPVATAAKVRKAVVAAPQVISFGLDAPTQAGDYGLIDDQGMVWLAWAQPSDSSAEPGDFTLQRLMPADALRIRGRHNAANALAALALARASGAEVGPMLHALRAYKGEPHRVQSVAVHEGIEIYDDSKGTNVGATVAAIAGLGPDKAPGRLVLILGGEGKGQDFTPLLAPLRHYARAVALIGKDAPRLAQLLATEAWPVQSHATLEEATAWSLAQARSGDAVLLSPACASLDMFRNYVHRGECFVAAVRACIEQAGGVWA